MLNKSKISLTQKTFSKLFILYKKHKDSVGQNVIIQAIHVNYTSWCGKLSENYAESKK